MPEQQKLSNKWYQTLKTIRARLRKREKSPRVLKMNKLWSFNQHPNKPVLVAWKPAWINEDEPTCIFLRYMVNWDAFHEIEYHTNASDPRNLLESIFKPKATDFLNDILQRLDWLKLTDCKSSAKYISQFQDTINELRSFSAKFKLDDNFLIYQFQSSLGLENSSYDEWYTQEQDPFIEVGDTKYTLISSMKHFWNTIKNINVKYLSSQIRIVALTAKTSWGSVSYLAPNSPLFQRIIQNDVKPRVSQRVLRIEKTVKYCTYCHYHWETDDDCLEKFPRICKSSSVGVSQTGNGKITKAEKKMRQKTNSGTNASAPRHNSGQASFYAHFPELACFIATASSTSMKLSSVWIWDSANPHYICQDRSAFSNFQFFSINLPLQA